MAFLSTVTLTECTHESLCSFVGTSVLRFMTHESSSVKICVKGATVVICVEGCVHCGGGRTPLPTRRQRYIVTRCFFVWIVHLVSQACVVLALGEEGEDKHLVAYLVPNEGATKKLIRANLKRKLPFYMVIGYIYIYLSSIMKNLAAGDYGLVD